MKFSIETPEIYRKIILGEGTLKAETIEAAIEHHIALALERSPTPKELAKFTEFARREIEKTGRYFGLRNAMIAVMVSPTFIYLSELGLGEVQEDGCSMLSPAELAYAISYGLADQKPDEALREASKTGRLQTREDVKREVLRILMDDAIEKPRILRFFHQYFGYDRAPEVFKDDKRFFKGYTFWKSARNYVKETDTLVQHILKEDKDVIKKLLTTEEYYVQQSGDNEEERQATEASTKLYA
ncbi:MAG: hypothetical protein ACJAVK_003460, partial [Akkermansiaceae bacterium]